MPTSIESILDSLLQTGVKLRKNLWLPEDRAALAVFAQDLLDLEEQARKAPDENARREIAADVQRVLDHVAILALSRLNVVGKEAAEAARQTFLTLVREWLPQLLKALAGLV